MPSCMNTWKILLICILSEHLYLIYVLATAPMIFYLIFIFGFQCLICSILYVSLCPQGYTSVLQYFRYVCASFCIYIPLFIPVFFLFSLNFGCRLREWLEVYDCIGLRSYRQGGTTISCHSLRRTQRSYTTPLAQPPFDRFYAMPRQLYAWWVVFTIPHYLHRTLGQVYFRYLR